jgi:hypothetical protein
MGLAPLTMQAVALEKFPERRWLAKLRLSDARHFEGLEGVHLYAPMTTQLTSARTALTAQEN